VNSPSVSAAAASVVALLDRREFRKAAAEAEMAVKRAPGSVELWNLLGAAWLLAGELAKGERATAKALALDPASADARRNHDVALQGMRARCREALSTLADPEDEGGRLEAAFQAVVEADDASVLDDDLKGPALAVFLRLAAGEAAERRWPFASIGRDFAARGEHRSLLYQIPRADDDADRRELLEQHRAWGRLAEARAAAEPVERAPRGPRSRLRVGLLSSDLRIHVVTAFADPLIEHAQENGVDLYCYSAQPGAPDGAQQHIAGRVTEFRHLPGAGALEMARAVAADAPDVLIEIGGSTNANRLEAMAHRLAPVQASWLGYPHSAGLATIDHMVLDPYLAPTDPSLMIERPLLMPRSWIALSPGFFRDEPRPVEVLPEDRKGFITFGSANSAYKYTPAALQAWARVMAAVPRSRFLFVRPEGGSATFRRNVAEAFAKAGVGTDRLDFAAVRGGHLPYYGEIDISLDTFPLTGGTTTCEALWMGVPVISLRGPAIYERLSHSILNNVGLGDLSVDSGAAFVAKGVALAGDPGFRRDWRAQCRRQIMAGALGDMRQFAEDFFRMLRGLEPAQVRSDA